MKFREAVSVTEDWLSLLQNPYDACRSVVSLLRDSTVKRSVSEYLLF